VEPTLPPQFHRKRYLFDSWSFQKQLAFAMLRFQQLLSLCADWGKGIL
jgi:hypothetical protein